MKNKLRTLLLLLLLLVLSVFPVYYIFLSFNYSLNEASFSKNASIQRKAIFPHPWMAFSNYELLVYSAFWDVRTPVPLMRILMYRDHRKDHEAECVVELNDGTSVLLPGIFNYTDYENEHNVGRRIYWPTYLECPAPNLTLEPYAVAIRMANVTSPFLNVMQVKNTQQKEHFLTVCTKALFNFGDWLRLVFFIEYYRAVGADKFIFYKHSFSGEVEKVLQFYNSSGMVSIILMPRIPHPSPMPQYVKEFEKQHWFGQQVQIPDCIFRSVGVTEFWTDVDIDEYIGNPSGTEPNFLRHLLADVPTDIGGVHIRSGFWNGNWPKSSISNFQLSQLESMQMFSPFKISAVYVVETRSKMFVRPESVVTKSVHIVRDFLPGYQKMVKSPDKAILYHLRQDPLVRPVVVSNPFNKSTLSTIMLENIKKVIEQLKRN